MRNSPRRAGKETHEDARGRRRIARTQASILLLGQLEAPQAPASDHDRSVGGLPDVDPELPEDAEIAFDIVGLGNVADACSSRRARAAAKAARWAMALSPGGRQTISRALVSLSPIVTGVPSRRPAPAASGRLGRSACGSDMRSMTSVSDQQRLGFLVVDGRGRNPVGHAPRQRRRSGSACAEARDCPRRRRRCGLTVARPSWTAACTIFSPCCRSRHHDGLPRRLCPALAAGIDVGIAVGNGDVGETGPPVSADETAVRLVTFELIDDLEERQRLVARRRAS